MQAVMKDGNVGPVEAFNEDLLLEALKNPMVDQVKVFNCQSPAHENSKKLWANMSRTDRKRIRKNLRIKNAN